MYINVINSILEILCLSDVHSIGLTKGSMFRSP